MIRWAGMGIPCRGNQDLDAGVDLAFLFMPTLHISPLLGKGNTNLIGSDCRIMILLQLLINGVTVLQKSINIDIPHSVFFSFSNSQAFLFTQIMDQTESGFTSLEQMQLSYIFSSAITKQNQHCLKLVLTDVKIQCFLRPQP